MRKWTLFSLAALLAAVVALTPVARAQSAGFLLSQHGRSVGTASFSFNATPHGYNSTSVVRIAMPGLNYSLSKTQELGSSNNLHHVDLSASVNGSAVTVNAAPEPEEQPKRFLISFSVNGQTTSNALDLHPAAVFLPDFDPGAFETLLALAVARNNRDLWAIIPKKEGSIVPIQLATYADEQGTLDGQPIVVHHLKATIAGTTTDLFSGPSNQLLQAELPQKGFALVRNGFVLTPPAKPGAPPAQ
jgi:hypothetical protein